MELEGSLGVFPLPEVLQFLAQGRMSGTLALTRADTTIHLEIRDGKIINSSTMDRAHKLGEMLVHRNVIPRRVLEEALATQRQTDHGQLLGELLIEQGNVTRDQLRSAIRLQMEEEIWELFGWHEGQFKFENGRTSLERPAAAEIEIEPLLLEGSRRMDEWQHITKNINEDDDVFTVVAPEVGKERVFPVKEREWTVLALINGSFNVGSIIARTGFGTFETYRILNRLLMAGLIRKLPKYEERQQAPKAHGKATPHSNGNSSGSSRMDSVASHGIMGLLQRKKNNSGTAVSAPEVAVKASVETSTPIGLLAAYINALVASLLANGDFSMGEMDDAMLAGLWRQVINICPKADLVRVENNQMNADAFEKFVAFGAANSMQGCYDDTIEAVSRLLGRLYKLASQRLGERNAYRIFKSSCESFAATGPVAFDEEFVLGAFVSKTIG